MTLRFSSKETSIILGRSMRSCYSSAIYAWLLEIVSKLIILLFPYLSVTPSDNGVIYTTVGWISPNSDECRTSAIPPERELYYSFKKQNGLSINFSVTVVWPRGVQRNVNNLTPSERNNRTHLTTLLFVQRRRQRRRDLKSFCSEETRVA